MLSTLLFISSLLVAPILAAPTALPIRSANVSEPDTVDMVASTWFAGWHAAPGVSPIFAVANISWEKYTSMSYAFAITTDDADHIGLADADKTILPEFVKAAHDNGVEARISYGGWGGSQHFSSAFASANRSATIKAMLKLVSQYDLDGIDFDWEYPGKQGIGCNEVNPSDTDNFLATLQELRKDPAGAKLILTAAVATPFTDASGNPSTDLSGFAEALDYIQIMNYDINGNWSAKMGPNAPLNDSCVSDPSQAQGSAVSLVAKWHAAGFPMSKIVLGVAGYGHTFAVDASSIKAPEDLTKYPAFDAGKSQGASFGDSWTSVGSTDQCGNFVPAGGSMTYWGLMENGLLTSNGTAASGVLHAFDDCSQTDYVFNPDTGVAVSYDSPRAFTAKGQFIKDTGLRGFSMWEAGDDFQDQLIDAIRLASGFEDSNCDGEGSSSNDNQKRE